MTQERVDLTWRCGHTAHIMVGYTQGDLKYKMAMMASTLQICASCEAKRSIERAWKPERIALERLLDGAAVAGQQQKAARRRR
mgnify:CR=1 FL=1